MKLLYKLWSGDDIGYTVWKFEKPVFGYTYKVIRRKPGEETLTKCLEGNPFLRLLRDPIWLEKQFHPKRKRRGAYEYVNHDDNWFQQLYDFLIKRYG